MEPSGFNRDNTFKILEEMGKLAKALYARSIIFESNNLSIRDLNHPEQSSSSSATFKAAQLVKRSLSLFYSKPSSVEGLSALEKLIRNITDCIAEEKETKEQFSKPLEDAIFGLESLSSLAFVSAHSDRSDLVKTAIANLKKANDEIKELKRKADENFEDPRAPQAQKPDELTGSATGDPLRSSHQETSYLGSSSLDSVVTFTTKFWNSASEAIGLRSSSMRASSETTQSDRAYLQVQRIKEFVGPCYVIPKKTLSLLNSTFENHPHLAQMFDNYLNLLSRIRESQFNLYRQEICWLQTDSKPALFFTLDYAVRLQTEIKELFQNEPASVALRNFTKELLFLAGIIQNSQTNRDYFTSGLIDPKILLAPNFTVSMLDDQPVILTTRQLETTIRALLLHIRKLDFIEEKFTKLEQGSFTSLEFPASLLAFGEEEMPTVTNEAEGLKIEDRLKREAIDRIKTLKLKIASLAKGHPLQEQFQAAVQAVQSDLPYTPTLSFGPATTAEWIDVKRRSAQDSTDPNFAEAFISGRRLFGLKQNERIREFEVPLNLSSLGPLIRRECKSVIEFIYEFDDLVNQHKDWLNTFLFALKISELENQRRLFKAHPLRNKSVLKELEDKKTELYSLAKQGMVFIPEDFFTLNSGLLHELLLKTTATPSEDLTDEQIRNQIFQHEQQVIDTQMAQLKKMVADFKAASSSQESLELLLQNTPTAIQEILNKLNFLADPLQKLNLLKLAAQFSYEFEQKTVLLWTSFGFDDDETHFSIPYQISLMLADLAKFIGPHDKLSPVLLQNLTKALETSKQFRHIFRDFFYNCVELRKMNEAIVNKPFARLISPTTPRHLSILDKIREASFLLQSSASGGPALDMHIRDYMNQILMRSGCCFNLQTHTDDYVSLLAPRREAALFPDRLSALNAVTTPIASDLIIGNSRSLRHTYFSYQQSLQKLSYINRHFDRFVKEGFVIPPIPESSNDASKYLNFERLFSIILEIEKTKAKLALELSVLESHIAQLEAENPELAQDVRAAVADVKDAGFIEGSDYWPGHKSEWVNVKYSDAEPFTFLSGERVLAFKINDSIHKITIPLDLSSLGKLTGEQSQKIFKFIYEFEEKLTATHYEAVNNFYFATSLHALKQKLHEELNKPTDEQNKEKIDSIQQELAEANRQILENVKLDPEITESLASTIKEEIASYEEAIKAHLQGQDFEDKPLVSSRSAEMAAMLAELDFLTDRQKTTLVLIANNFAYQLALNYCKMFMGFGFTK